MNRPAIKQALLLILTAFFCLAALFSSLFIYTHLDHDCTGDAECPVCIQIQGAHTFLRHIKTALTGVFLGMAVDFLARRTVKKLTIYYPLLLSAVTLKTRLNT
jgi:hypothetical protein